MCQWTMIMKLGSLFQIPSTKPVWNAEKIRWRYIRLAIKLRYLGNHASQIKSYYTTLSGSHGRSFKIRHKKSPEAPLADKSRWCHIRLAIKPRYLGNHASQVKKLLWNAIRKSWSLFQNASRKISWSPLAEKSRWRHIHLAIKSRYIGNHASQIKSYYGTLSGSHDRSFRIHHEKLPEAPLAAKSRWFDILLVIKARNHASQIKSWITIRKSWSLSDFCKNKTANNILKNLSVYKCCWWRESLAYNSKYIFFIWLYSIAC